MGKINRGANDTTIVSDTFISFQPGNTEKAVLRADGDLEVAKNVEAVGNVTGAAGTFTGAVTGASFAAAGALSGASLSVGNVQSGVAAASLSAVTQSTGSGLADMTAEGTFTGTTDTVYNVKIKTEGTPDHISWGTGVSTTNGSADTAITAGAMTLANGVTVTFAATTGHTANDVFTFTAYRERTNLAVDGVEVGDDVDVVGNIIGVATSRIVLGDDATVGSWQFVRSGDDLLIQRFEVDAWVTKSTIAAID